VKPTELVSHYVNEHKYELIAWEQHFYDQAYLLRLHVLGGIVNA